MSRTQGIFSFSANFETNIAEPLDARSRVQFLTDLYDENNFGLFGYEGMLVSVYGDIEKNNGVYLLKTLPCMTPANWEKVGADSIQSYNLNFLTSDWQGPTGGLYTIDFVHNLHLPRVEIEVWDSSNAPVYVERIITSLDIITLRVPSDPDLRFAGSIWIKNN